MKTIIEFYLKSIRRLPNRVGDIVLYMVNWITQGFIFASLHEKIAKATLELMVFVPVFLIASQLLRGPKVIIIGFVISHTVNWVIATNIYSTRKKGTHGTDDLAIIRDRFTPPVLLVQRTAESSDHIRAAAIFGSFARGEAHLNSDLDVHIYSKIGIFKMMKNYLLLFKLRFVSNVNGYPLDIWIERGFDNQQYKKSESPIIIYDDGYLSSRYPNSEAVTRSPYFN